MSRRNFPAVNSAAYLIMQTLHEKGPLTGAQLQESGYDGAPAKVALTLQSWIEKGWVMFSGLTYSLSPFAHAYYGGDSKPVFVGIPATGCTFNMLTRPPYKSPRTYRREGPEWAQRPAGFGFKSAMGAKELA